MQEQTIEIRPQEGFQEAFLSTEADIAIGGGSAGGGKTYAMLLDPLHFTNDVKDFEAVFFRRTYPEITNPGGLKPSSDALYPLFGARAVALNWHFPSGATVGFRHLQHENDMYSWQGAQIQAIYFDELTHFLESQFWYMVSRNRNPTANGIRPYIRACCNPDPDSFVAELISWWIDQQEQLEDGSPNPRYGYPIPERCGLLRYFVRDNDETVWGDTPEEVMEKAPHLFTGELAGARPKSITFIPGDIFGNKILLKNDPGYLGNLLSLPEAEQNKLLRGNWKVRLDGLALYDPSAVGSIFTNYPPTDNQTTYITGDIARFGHDWTVLMAWRGWEVVGMVIMKVNDAPEAVKAIEMLRDKFGVMAHNVLIDQNGVGGQVLDLRPDYEGFINNARPLPDPVTREVENYENLKTQCYYRSAQRTNAGGLKMTLSNDNVWIYESSDNGRDGYNHVVNRTCKTKMGGKLVDVRDIVKEQLRAIRKKEVDERRRQRINSKDEQKIILRGWSPDFADCIMMREYFVLTGPRRMIRGFDNS